MRFFLSSIVISFFFVSPLLAVAEMNIKSAAASAEKTTPLSVGSAVPSAEVRTVEGEKENLAELIQGKKSVLIFYRGGWCPYCNTQLGEIGNIEPKLREMGFQVLALSPDRPEKLKASMRKHKLSYDLISDSKMNAALGFGLAFKVDDATVSLYKNSYNIDLEADSGEKHHLLPVPAAYVVDKAGKIVFAYANADYKVRVDAKELLKAAEAVQ